MIVSVKFFHKQIIVIHQYLKIESTNRLSTFIEDLEYISREVFQTSH